VGISDRLKKFAQV